MPLDGQPPTMEARPRSARAYQGHLMRICRKNHGSLKVFLRRDRHDADHHAFLQKVITAIVTKIWYNN